jgi:DoxX-like protein
MNTAMKYALPEGGAAGTKAIWVGRILSALAIAFFVMDGVMKLIQPQVVIDATRQIGWPVDPMTLTSLGLILLACTALYAFPRTAVLGAILLTGYLGGAVASHARHGDPLLTHELFVRLSRALRLGRTLVSRRQNSIADPLRHVAHSARAGSV